MLGVKFSSGSNGAARYTRSPGKRDRGDDMIQSAFPRHKFPNIADCERAPREEKKRRLDGVNGLLSVIGRFAGRRVLLFFCEVPVFLALAARSLGANQ
jgi:hypothetical protein